MTRIRSGRARHAGPTTAALAPRPAATCLSAPPAHDKAVDLRVLGERLPFHVKRHAAAAHALDPLAQAGLTGCVRGRLPYVPCRGLRGRLGNRICACRCASNRSVSDSSVVGADRRAHGVTEIAQEMKAWLGHELPRLPGRSNLAEAIRYRSAAGRRCASTWGRPGGDPTRVTMRSVRVGLRHSKATVISAYHPSTRCSYSRLVEEPPLETAPPLSCIPVPSAP